MKGSIDVVSLRARAPEALTDVYVAGALQFTSGGNASTAIAIAERPNRTTREIPILLLEKKSMEDPPI
jgi:hypothetical protein